MKATPPAVDPTKASKAKNEAVADKKPKSAKTASSTTATGKSVAAKAAPAKAVQAGAGAAQSAPADVAAAKPGPVKKTVQKKAAGVMSKVVFDLQAIIEIEAYLLAERRGFAPGNELGDWLEAEQAVLNQLGRNGSSDTVRQ